MSRSAVLDASAVVAIYANEPAATEVEARLREGCPFYMAAPTLVELRLVLSGRFGKDGKLESEAIRDQIGFMVIPFTEVHAEVAHEAWLRYGKGRHPAALNFGDCLSYAAAKVAGAELIYVGDDFARTDLA